MVKHSIKLSDGTVISSGVPGKSAIAEVELTQCVNSGEELTLGSVCSAMAEIRLFIYGETGYPQAGESMELYEGDRKIGTFYLEKPTRQSANVLKLKGFDAVSKLDRDLTQWLGSLTGWPYRMDIFARMVCTQCGVALGNAEIRNGDIPVYAVTDEGISGRKLMQWIAEAGGYFVKADPNGNICLDTYRAAPTVISAEGGYFGGMLQYEDYAVADVDAVQLRLGQGEEGYLWPEAAENANSYIIYGNPFLQVTDGVADRLERIRQAIPTGYRPCKVTVPADTPVQAGDMFAITDASGVTFQTLAMTCNVKGARMTIECTGSQNRKAVSARYEKTEAQKQAEADHRAQQAAQAAVEGQSQRDILDKLTNKGQVQGLYLHDGQLYVNASYIRSGTLDAQTVNVINLVAQQLASAKDGSVLSVEGARMQLANERGVCVDLACVGGGMPIFYLDNNAPGRNEHAEIAPHMLKIGGTSVNPFFSVQALNGYSEMKVDAINPGKKLLFEGTAAVGSSFEVPGSTNYDLFAIRLGTEQDTWVSTVLAYRSAGQVRGIGGCCGTTSTPKELHFVTIYTGGTWGNTWKVEDAGYHAVSMSGGVTAGKRLYVRQVRGII